MILNMITAKPNNVYGSGPIKVRFFDYDGTILREYHVASGASVTAPPVPNHTAEGLTFQRWNYDDPAFTNITSDLDVGATYITTDGKTHFHITLTTASGLIPTFYFIKSDNSEMTIDYGDGTSETVTGSGSIPNFVHTYATAGNYIVKVWISSGTGTFTLGQGASGTAVVGGGALVYLQTLTACFIGEKANLADYSFYNCWNLRVLTIPNGIGLSNASVCANCRNLQHMTLPYQCPTVGVRVLSGCYGLRAVSLPETSASTIGEAAMQSCYSLQSLIIPAGYESYGNNAFSTCSACEYYILKRTGSTGTFGSNVFVSIASLSKIKVPSADLAAYQATANISTYANYMEGY